jgi:hypothetical protein
MALEGASVRMPTHVPEVPPRWAEQLLRVLLKSRDKDTIIGDLREEYHEVVVPTHGRFGAQLWYMRQVVSFVGTVTLGVLLGAAFGLWLLVHTRLDPLAEETPMALLTFFGPMFTFWGMAGFGAARRAGRLLDAIKVGATVAFVTFVVYDLAQFVRVNVFLDAIRQRPDWRHILSHFEQSGYESLRGYVNYVGLTGAPFKILAATTIGACMGGIGGLVASLPRRDLSPTPR